MRRTRRPESVLTLAIFTLVCATATTTAAEIAGSSGLVTLAYDESLWQARLDEAGEPELLCTVEACGGDTAGCGSVVLRREGGPLTREEFLGAFRENLDAKTLESARTNAGENARPEIVSPASAAAFGGNAGVSLSLRIAFDGVPTRVDHFWLLAGSALAGLTCVVVDTEYDRARPAFERVFSDVTIRSP